MRHLTLEAEKLALSIDEGFLCDYILVIQEFEHLQKSDEWLLLLFSSTRLNLPQLSSNDAACFPNTPKYLKKNYLRHWKLWTMTNHPE